MMRLIIFCFFCLTFPVTVLCQQVFLLAGQSNASGQGDSALSNSRYFSPNAIEYDILEDRLKELHDPTGQSWKALQPANSGSILPAFAFTITNKTKKKVIVISAARGGSSCNQKAELSDYGTWDSTGNLFEQTKEKVNAALKHVQCNLSGIIWMQGERDANAINDGLLTGEAYKSSLISLIVRFRNEFGHEVPFFVTQTGYQSGRPMYGNDQIRKIQSDVTRELANVYIAYSETSSFVEKNWMKDHVHYNQNGLNDIGLKSGKLVAKILKL